MENQNTSTPTRTGLNGHLSFALEAQAYDRLCQGAEALATLKELIEQFGTGPIEVTGNGLASLLGCISEQLEGSLKQATRSQRGAA